MRRQKIEHLPPRVGGGLRIVAEFHAENRTIGKPHVEGMRAAWIYDKLEHGRGCRLRGLHLLAKTRGRLSALPMGTTMGAWNVLLTSL